MNINVQIIILAAGKGKRMKSDIPKALAMFKGKSFIAHILDTIKKLNLRIRPIIVVGHKKEDIKRALGKGHIYAEQEKQLGTGHAVMSAKNKINNKHNIVLVIYADQPLVSKETLQNIIEKQKAKNPSMTLATVLTPDFKDWRMGLKNYGRIIRGNDGSVKKILESKDANDEERKNRELNPAFYAFNAKWLWDNINKLENKNVQGEYYLTDLIKMACEQNMKIETVPVKNIIEALQPNSKEELEILEKLSV